MFPDCLGTHTSLASIAEITCLCLPGSKCEPWNPSGGGGLYFNYLLWPSMVEHTLDPSTWVVGKFESSLVYRASLRTARAIQSQKKLLIVCVVCCVCGAGTDVCGCH